MFILPYKLSSQNKTDRQTETDSEADRQTEREREQLGILLTTAEAAAAGSTDSGIRYCSAAYKTPQTNDNCVYFGASSITPDQSHTARNNVRNAC